MIDYNKDKPKIKTNDTIDATNQQANTETNTERTNNEQTNRERTNKNKH